MKSITQYLNYYGILSVLVVASPLIITSLANAEYKPPSGDPPSSQTVMNGSRSGCGGEFGNIPLLGVIPMSHIGRTSKIDPEVTVFIPLNDYYRLNISVYEETTEGSRILVYENQEVETKTGLMTLPLSSRQKPLKEGYKYVWEVAIACDQNSPLFDQTFVGELKVVPPSSSLVNSLADSKTPLEKSNLYAQEGYWYDAIAEAVSTYNSSKTEDSSNEIIKLIDNLVELESSHQATHLKKIAGLLE